VSEWGDPLPTKTTKPKPPLYLRKLERLRVLMTIATPIAKTPDRVDEVQAVRSNGGRGNRSRANEI
jgi:hypothetical protein